MRKTTRKIIAVLLALTMSMSMGSNAFAAEVTTVYDAAVQEEFIAEEVISVEEEALVETEQVEESTSEELMTESETESEVETEEVLSSECFGEETDVLDASRGSDYSYTKLSNGTIEITEFTGSDTVVSIPSSIDGKTVTRIGNSAFFNQSNLTSVSIPGSVTYIGEDAFYDCTNLSSVTISRGVITIGPCAFCNCKSLTSIMIPNSVTIIGECAFAYCDSLKSITIPNSVTNIENGAFNGCSSLTSITIPSSITSISANVFKNCENLTSITIPDSVTNIESGAFDGCSSLTSITIPSSVTTIGDAAFVGCWGLADQNGLIIVRNVVHDCKPDVTSIAIPDGVTVIGSSAFAYLSNLTSVTIPSSVTTIRACAFYNSKSLKSITMPSSVTSIGESAFSGCKSLKSIAIPSSVTTIGNEAFEGCWGLADHDGLVIVRNVVYDCKSSVTSITIPSSVTIIGNRAFYGCKSLASITIPSSVTRIEAGAFSYCESLTSVTIPSSVTTIGANAFFHCISFTSIKIPYSVTTIGHSAFRGCRSLASIAIPKSIKSIKHYTFSYCNSLTNITIPDSVTTIGNSAFYACTNLASITIPSSVTSIGDCAFGACTSLTSITIPNSVTTIGSCAFDECSSLTSIIIPSSVTTIKNRAFYGCNSMTSITIPSSVTTIGENAVGMQFNEKDRKYYAISGFVIYCEKGSAAEKYAKENRISYELVQCCDVPVLKSVSNTTTGVKVSWQASAGAEKYRVYYKTGSGKWTKVADTTSTSYTVSASKLTSGTTYAFTARCVSADGTSFSSDYDTTGLKLMYLAPLTSTDLTISNVIAGVKVSWNSVGGAEGYIISRRPATTTTYKEIGRVTDSSTLTYTDANVESGTKYYYSVRAYCGTTKGSYSGKSILALGAVVKDDMTISNLSSGLKISWKQIIGAEGYYVYRKASSASDYTKVGTVTSGSTVTYTDTEATNGTTYAYRVRAYCGTTMGGYYSKTAVRLTTPSITSLSNVAAAKMTVKWGANTMADGYQVRYSIDSAMPSGSYTTVTVTSASTISETISSLTKGNTYYVKVRSYKTVGTTRYYSGWSTKKSVEISK